MQDTALAVAVLSGILGVSALVYRDARRVGVSSPLLWAALVFWLATLGVGLVSFVPTVPVPGALILVIGGPVLYLFERDDAKHGDEPADPHVLPDFGPGDDGEGGPRNNSEGGPRNNSEGGPRDDPEGGHVED